MKLFGRCFCGMASPLRCVCDGQAPPRDVHCLSIERRNARRRQRSAERRARRAAELARVYREPYDEEAQRCGAPSR